MSLLTRTKPTDAKVHHSEYIRSEDKPPKETTQPEEVENPAQPEEK